ncbi:signal transduction histidine kinase [Nitrospirillum amazonense]|uniref:histidine kinase n=1 Tax=Nitrospirillum amazonense TaxID=28077 RepID=A0A560ES98_9PROT|nr:PAS domain-containing protein [Nitrospirillum amazonense]TWB12244.1 signal transduction histidine kinase [Nitrospirillum amazonense]
MSGRAEAVIVMERDGEVLPEVRALCGPLLDALVQSGMPLTITDHRRPGEPLVFANPAFERLTGHAFSGLANRPFGFLAAADADPAILAGIEEALAADRPLTADLRVMRKDGTIFWDRLRLTPVVDGQGATPYFLWTHCDQTVELARMEVEAELAASRQALANAKERARLAQAVGGTAGAWEWDVADGRLYADARFAELYGLDPVAAGNGLSTDAFFDSIHTDDRMRIRIAVAGVMHGADIFAKDYRVVGRDGTVRWVSARGGADRAADGVARRFRGVLADITEQKRVEEQLRVAQTAGGVGTFEYISGFGTVSVSEQFCRLLGLHPTTALPVRTVNAVVLADDAPLITSLEGGETAPPYREFRIRRPDTGEIRWLAQRGEHRRDGKRDREGRQGSGSRFIGVIYDITASKDAEEKLRQFAETLEARVEERTRERDRVWNNSRDLLVIIGADGICRAVSPSWTAILGHETDKVVGRQVQDFVHADDVVATAEALMGALHDQNLTNFENRQLHKDGSLRWISWNTSKEGDLVYAYGRDITEDKQRADMLRQTEEQLRQAQKMEAVGQLTGGLAHDFNNMLMGVIGGLDIVRRRISQGRLNDLDRFMDASMASAQRAAALTHRLLAFSRRQSLDPKPIDVNDLVRSMEDLLRRTLGEQIELRITVAENLTAARSDVNQLESAILNLAINARDAMPDGGILTIETSRATLDRSYTHRHDGLSPGDYVMIRVSDTGMGMPPDVVAKAFDPFFTTKPIGQGTGLGLSMIYGFVKQTGGHVRIDSEPWRGTAITLYLPCDGGANAQDGGLAGMGEMPEGAGEIVLVVEDDDSVRLLVLDVLQELGYTALHAADGRGALSVIESSSQIDLLITDVGLPGLNGRQLAEIARRRRPNLPVLFVTGYAANAAVRGDFLEPGMDMVMKPFAMDELAAKIRGILEERQVLAASPS